MKLLCTLIVCAAQDVAPPATLAPVPSPRQLAWAELEYCAFVHFNMNTFTGAEWGTGQEDPALFAPSALDCRQWVRVARDAGMKGIILTAKHHDGFCLWPSKLTEHDVERSPFRGGKGDVLRELSDACREHGLEFGVYLSPWDRNSPKYGDSPRYNEHFRGQLREVLSSYGDVFEVWFDGACGEGPNGKRQVYDWPSFVGVVRELQPNAVIFSDVGPDVRWVGNEKGFAGETCWSMLSTDGFEPGEKGPPAEVLNSGEENGTRWIPAECDVSIRPGWYYHSQEDAKTKSLRELVDIWEGSVGRNASLLLNLPVDRRGLVHESDVARLMELRSWLDATYGRDFARSARATLPPWRGLDPRFGAQQVIDGDRRTYWAAGDVQTAGWIDLELAQPAEIDRVVLGEAIELGQRVTGFRVTLHTPPGSGRGGGWSEGTTIGRKRILRFPPTLTSKVRIEILSARATPTLAFVSLHRTPD